jgi:hypothetical protein
LKDIFNIQNENAKAVTAALSVTLGVGHFNVPGMTHNIEAYDEYFRAGTNISKFMAEWMLTGIDHLKNALAIDPDFGLVEIIYSLLLEEAVFFHPIRYLFKKAPYLRLFYL